ncbi:MAG: hypothetical protein Q7S61_06210 [bacterium]|nr:hypothetical protein [bacterium]
MKKVLVFLVMCILFSLSALGGLILYQDNKVPFLNKDLPTSFQECNNRRPIENIFNWWYHETSPFCRYFTEENSRLYQKCIETGGNINQIACPMCSGCGCKPAGCTLIYIDPSFKLPINAKECEGIAYHGGASDIRVRNGQDYCYIDIFKKGVVNIQVANGLYDECVSKGGEVDADGKSCEWRLFKDRNDR